jgi:hypothetical protein
MKTSEECARHARFCEQKAEGVSDAMARLFLRQAAEDWRHLAVENSDHRPKLFMMTKRS